MSKVRIECEGSDRLPLDKLKGFQGKAKTIKRENLDKLKGSITKHGFSAPIFVWRDDEGMYHLLDGHQRTEALRELESEGWEIPEIPVASVEASDVYEAKSKLIHIASQYGDWNKAGVQDFVLDMDASDLFDTARLTKGDFDIFPDQDEDDEKPEVEFAEELMENHNYVVLYFDNDVDWLQVETILQLETVKAKFSKPGFVNKGVGRVVNGAEAIEKFREAFRV